MIVLTLCLLTVLASRAEGVHYFKGTVYEALAAAQRQSKMLIVEFYAKWNYKSRWMNQNVVSRRDVYEVLDQSYVLVMVDTQTKDGAALALQYEITDYPAFVVFNQNGNVIDKIETTLDRNDFVMRLNQVEIENDGSSSWTINKIYSSAEQGDRESASKLAMEYLSKQTKEKAISPLYWDMFTNLSITYYPSEMFKYLVENRDDFALAIGKIKTDDLICSILTEASMQFAIGSHTYDSLRVDEIESIAARVNVVQSEVLIDLCRLTRFREEGNLDKYIETMNYALRNVSQEMVVNLLLSLEIVAERGDEDQKKLAKSIVEKYGKNSYSSSQSMLVETLIKKLSE